MANGRRVHVLTEKPVVMTMTEAREVVRAALHLDLFKQPERTGFFSILLVQVKNDSGK